MRASVIGWRGNVAALLAVLLTGCAGATYVSLPTPPALPRHLGSATCVGRAVVNAPLPQEVGVYRAGPLTLVVGEDLAPVSSGR